jgi:hypothetical protein
LLRRWPLLDVGSALGVAVLELLSELTDGARCTLFVYTM